MTSLSKRVLSAVIFLPFFIFLIYSGTPFYFMLLVMAASLLGLAEFFSLSKDKLSSPLRLAGYIWTMLIIFGAYSGGSSVLLGTLSGGILIIFLIRLYNGKRLKGVIEDVGYLYTGIFYVVFLLSYLVLLRGSIDGSLWILLLFIVTWGGDTAAFFSGRAFGNRKFYLEVSPKKSVEGFIGGFFGGIVAALLFKVLFFNQLTLTDSIIAGAVIGILGPLGDLCESLLKRSCDVKDSGGLIPGHGGILDRIDSILFSAPFVYYFAIYTAGMQG